MKCLICNSPAEYFFSKKYSDPGYDQFNLDFEEVQYYKCTNCGFVLSKTHGEMDKDKWKALNHLVHEYQENPQNQKEVNQPPYLEQAMMILILGKNKIINTGNMIDYAAGYGTLSKILSGYFNITLPIFDPYVKEGNSDKYIDKNHLTRYATVLNSAMFEHILSRDDLEKVNKLVSTDGCLIIHTLICETIPKDPNWFYLRPPVHTAFHTNKSMELLMKQWGYHSSVYCPKSKCWILFKEETENIEKKIKSINAELQTNFLYYKKGFVDYWKGF